MNADASGPPGIVAVRDLVFEYPGVRAVDGVTLNVAEGSVTALVGPNGAGKTTLLRCVAALQPPFSGDIRVDGVDVQAHPRACHRRIGFLSDFYGLYDDLPVARCLTHAARARGMGEDDLPSLVERTAARLQLADRLDQPAGTLSRGLRQRLAIAQALIHNPRVLLLDEPASGLDPEARHQLAVLMRQLQAEGMTLVVSSHILAELEAYSTAMVVMRDGRIVDAQTLAGADDAAQPLRIEVLEPPGGFGALLESHPGVGGVRVEGPVAQLNLIGGPEARASLLEMLVTRGVRVVAFEHARPSLQDTYLERMGGE